MPEQVAKAFLCNDESGLIGLPPSGVSWSTIMYFTYGDNYFPCRGLSWDQADISPSLIPFEVIATY